MQNKLYCKGFTIIEILISVLILAIGLLGLAGLQTSGLRSVNNASLFTESTIAVNDIIERMRTNPIAVNTNDFSAIDSATDIDCSTMPNPYCSQYYNEDSSSLVPAQSCSVNQMAAYDLNVWFCGERTGNASRAPGVTNQFPQASVTINCIDTNPASGADTDPCTDGSPHTVTLQWQELNINNDADATPPTRSVSMTFMPGLQ